MTDVWRAAGSVGRAGVDDCVEAVIGCQRLGELVQVFEMRELRYIENTILVLLLMNGVVVLVLCCFCDLDVQV
jgi:hypothetical protein